ncbi:MAG TPA: feruloyl-CoA synthase, partial [Burkholderiaceae bacterium]|nr:feruloyl-CoA synthase [Burkholderiaceae bacterium]
MTEPRYREGTLGGARVDVQRRADGTLLVRRDQPLRDYPPRITDRLVHWAREAPQRSFVARREQGGRWRHISFAQMLERARAIGQALLDRQLSAERPLVILSENDLEHATLAAAALYSGVPFAAISPAYSLVSKDYGKLRHIVALLTPGLVFAADGERYAAAIEAAVPADIELVVSARAPSRRRATPFAELLATRATPAVDAANSAIGPDSIAKFLFTSGSTKAPKGVINTHRMLCSNQQVLAQEMPFLAEEPPVLVDWLPWNHTFGGNHNYGIAMYNGGTLHIDDGKPVPGLFAETLRNLREIAPTIYFNVPKGFEELAAALRDDAGLRERFFSRLQLLFSAGAGMPDPVAHAIYRIAEQHCGERIGIYTGLGMTETAPYALGVARVGELPAAIGTPGPGITLKLVPNGGKLEVRYRGPGVTPGYWRAPELTRASFDDEGFFISGDAIRFIDESHPSRGFVFDGRVAEDFKLNTGTWVSVGPLRTLALAHGAPYVQDVVVTGHDRSEVGLLVFLRLERCRELAALPSDAPVDRVIADPSVRAFIGQLLDRINS